MNGASPSLSRSKSSRQTAPRYGADYVQRKLGLEDRRRSEMSARKCATRRSKQEKTWSLEHRRRQSLSGFVNDECMFVPQTAPLFTNIHSSGNDGFDVCLNDDEDDDNEVESNLETTISDSDSESIMLPSDKPLRENEPQYYWAQVFSQPTVEQVSTRESFYTFFQRKFLCFGGRVTESSNAQKNMYHRPIDLKKNGCPDGLTSSSYENLISNDSNIHIPNTEEDNNNTEGQVAIIITPPEPSPELIGASYYSPVVTDDDLITFTISNFEERRNEFNRKHSSVAYRKAAIERDISFESVFAEKDASRKEELISLGHLLADVSHTCFSEPADAKCSLVYNKQGLNVWKKEFGIGRILIRAEFFVPVPPLQYCKFASDPNMRKEWDSNLDHLRRIETLHSGVSVSYLALKRVATVFPRDTVNLKMIKKLKSYQKHLPSTTPQFDQETDSSGTYTSCSCSVEHPLEPEREDKVRMDLRIGSYVAEPLPTPFGLWTHVYSFNEGDPKGWIPSTVVKIFSAQIIPKSIERLVSGIVKHYQIATEGMSGVEYAFTKLKTVNSELLEEAQAKFKAGEFENWLEALASKDQNTTTNTTTTH